LSNQQLADSEERVSSWFGSIPRSDIRFGSLQNIRNFFASDLPQSMTRTFWAFFFRKTISDTQPVLDEYGKNIMEHAGALTKDRPTQRPRIREALSYS